MPSILNMFILAEAKKKNQDSTKEGEENQDPDVEDTQEKDEDLEDDSGNESDDTDDGDDLFKNIDAEAGSDDMTDDSTSDDDTSGDDTDDNGLGDAGEGLDNPDDLGDDTDNGDDYTDDTTENDDSSDTDSDDTSDDIDPSDDDYSDGEDDGSAEDEEKQKLKNKKLLADYFKLYTDIGDIIDSISNIDEHNKFEFSILIESIRNLEKLRYTINDYINIKFAKCSYEENLATYYKMTNSIKITDKIISNIIENRNKN